MTTRQRSRKLQYAEKVRWSGGIGVVLALSGCVVVPSTTRTPTLVAIEHVDVVRPPQAAMGVELSSVGGMVLVRALVPRVCVRETWNVVDIRTETTAELHDAIPDERELAFVALLIAPATLLVSGLITGIVIAASDTTRSRERTKVMTTQYECPIVGADLAVVLTLASGEAVELRTDKRGEARYEVAADAADSGTIGVQVGELAPRVVQYCRGACPPGSVVPVSAAPLPPPVDIEHEVAPSSSRAACLKLRSERMRAAQEVRDLKERTRRLQSLPVCPDR
jgi:hypothetical protein